MISELQQKNYFIIVNIHWGNEYETQNNSRQKFLARKFIEN
ncbi:MAG: CapA family protein [Patescibacteria group bacterium]